MKVYEAFEVDEETPVQWVAVHPLRWKPEWGEPAIMFREVDNETQDLLDAAPDLRRVAVAWKTLAEESLEFRLALTNLPDGIGVQLLEATQDALERAGVDLSFNEELVDG